MLKCPRCEAQMLTRRGAGGVALEVCRACEGTWFDQGELGRAVLDVQDQVTKTRFPTPERDNSAELRCPHCRKTMDRQTFGRTGVVIDLCATHGVFLDAGELEKIAAALDGEPPVAMASQGHDARVRSSGARSLEAPDPEAPLELAFEPPRKVAVGPKSFQPPRAAPGSGGGRDLGAVDRAESIWHASRAREASLDRRYPGWRSRGVAALDYQPSLFDRVGDGLDVVNTLASLYRILK